MPVSRDQPLGGQSPQQPRQPGLKYLQGYADGVQVQVSQLIAEGRLGGSLMARYTESHAVRNDAALYDYVSGLRLRHMKGAPQLAKVAYDNKLQIVQHALGTHTTVSRVQGSKLKAKREIRIASLFKQAPAPFLRMIVVHELAHLKERDHDRAFYALCQHMEPAYHELEFDLRLWLTWLDLQRAAAQSDASFPVGAATPKA